MISVWCEKVSVVEILDSLYLEDAGSVSTQLFCDWDKYHEMSFFDRTVLLRL